MFMTYVYILRGGPFLQQIYVGISGDLEQRLSYHNSGRCSHTCKFIPWEIVYSEMYQDKASALRRERQIKGWSRAKKEALIAGETERLRELARRHGG